MKPNRGRGATAGAMNFWQRARVRRVMAGLFAPVIVSLAAASGARAADRIYWTNTGGETISYAKLNDTGHGGNVNTTGAAALDGPRGLAMDLATGKIYWADSDSSDISFADLNGSGNGGDLNTMGAYTTYPWGITIDPASGELYWANWLGQSISYAALNESGGGDLTTAAPVDDPAGVAIDLAKGEIYWADSGDDLISYANLDGSGGGTLNTTGATVDDPSGVAIDPNNGRIYWTNGQGTDPISYAELNDSGGGGELKTGRARHDFPEGLAIDPEAGRVYWANGYSSTISYADLNNSDKGGEISTVGATLPDEPSFPALLKKPLAQAAPKLSGKSRAGAKLSCSRGRWAPDLIGSFLYQEAVGFSYSWSRDGKKIHGAKKPTLKAKTGGSYTCTVTAGNEAGSTSATSQPHKVR